MSRIIGLDLGSKTCGVAISDPSGFLARALTTIRFPDDEYEQCLDDLFDILEEEKVSEVVLGLPKHMNGDIGERGELSLWFGEQLENNGIKVIYWDERLSTMQMEKFLISADVRRNKRKKIIDQMSAVTILQGYLDQNQNKKQGME